jgi:hypothetical protein
MNVRPGHGAFESDPQSAMVVFFGIFVISRFWVSIGQICNTIPIGTAANDIDIFVAGGTNHQLHVRGVERTNGDKIK